MEELIKQCLPSYSCPPSFVGHVYVRYWRVGDNATIQYLIKSDQWLSTTRTVRDGKIIEPRDTIYLSEDHKYLASKPGIYFNKGVHVVKSHPLRSLKPVLIWGNDITIQPDPGWIPTHGDPYFRHNSIEGDASLNDGTIPPMYGSGSSALPADSIWITIIIIIIAAILTAGTIYNRIRVKEIQDIDTAAANIMANSIPKIETSDIQ